MMIHYNILHYIEGFVKCFPSIFSFIGKFSVFFLLGIPFRTPYNKPNILNVSEKYSVQSGKVHQMEEPIMRCGKIITETDRLIIREMMPSDLDALGGILCDEEVMRAAYESAFSVEEAQAWMNRHFKRYADYGFGLWAVVLKETNEMIGQCGLTLQRRMLLSEMV